MNGEPTPLYVFTSRAVTECVIRVRNLWCPELGAPGGLEVAEFTRNALTNAARIVAHTYKGQDDG